MGRRREKQITRNIIASINALFRLLKEFTGAPGKGQYIYFSGLNSIGYEKYRVTLLHNQFHKVLHRKGKVDAY